MRLGFGGAIGADDRGRRRPSVVVRRDPQTGGQVGDDQRGSSRRSGGVHEHDGILACPLAVVVDGGVDQIVERLSDDRWIFKRIQRLDGGTPLRVLGDVERRSDEACWFVDAWKPVECVGDAGSACRFRGLWCASRSMATRSGMAASPRGTHRTLGRDLAESAGGDLDRGLAYRQETRRRHHRQARAQYRSLPRFSPRPHRSRSGHAAAGERSTCPVG